MTSRIVTSLATTCLTLIIIVVAAWGGRDDGARPGRIVQIDAMDSQRAGHTMTTLPNGQVLIVGGFTTDEDRPAGAALFDPDTRTFSPVDGAEAVRQSHTATLLSDGRVLIAGGYGRGGRLLASAALFDPQTNTFSSVDDLPAPRAGQTAVTIPDGRVLLIGGMTANWRYVSSVVAFDPRSGSFADVGNLITARGSHTSTLLPDGKILVAAGHAGPRRQLTILQTAELFDPVSGTSTLANDLTVRRHKHDAVSLENGDVLVIGGSDERDFDGVYDTMELYDHKSGAFRSVTGLQFDRFKLRGTTQLLADGSVLVSGGALKAEIVDAKGTKTVAVPGASNLSGRFSASAPLPDGRVLITGGYGRDIGATDGAWLFVPGQ